MPSWTGGYAADIAYASSFHPQMSPHHMHAAALLNGWAPAPLPDAFTYCELGCGMGRTLAVLAAANPQARFVGVDFMPEHVLAGRQLAARGALSNIEFVEASFQDLAARADGLPPSDVIALHGVWSWVSAESRAAIVQLIGRHLNTGGLVYIGYNTLPGQLLGLPMQRLLRALAAQHTGRSDTRVRQAVAFIDRLAEAKAEAVVNNPIYQRIHDEVGKDRLGYLVHEYLNQSWDPMYFADVAGALAEAKLSFVGAADLDRSFPALRVSPEQEALLDEIADPILRETVADFCNVTGFRRDVFARGAQRLGRAEHDRMLRRLRLALTVPPARVGYKVKVLAGEAAMNEAAYRPMVAALSGGPTDIGTLMDLPEVQAHPAMQPSEVLGMLVSSTQAAVVPPGAPTAPAEAVRAFNRAVADAATIPGPGVDDALAAPGLGSGLAADLLERLIFRAIDMGTPADADALAEAVAAQLLARGEQILRDGKPVDDPGERHAQLADRMTAFLADWLPFWRGLGIV
ncbi:MAG: class I SAM-dependent methyltransferase [Alphaproteobacteria bacterium]